MSSYDNDFQEEKTHAELVLKNIKERKAFLERALDLLGSENLSKLQELRENAESNPMDLFSFIEQLDAQNKAFNIKDKIKQIEELGYLSCEPYFSRIDLFDHQTHTTEKVYIGKFGLTLDTKERPLITDWRAKIASVYYKYRYPQKNVSYETEFGEVQRDLLLKRTFEFDSGSLIKFYNNDIQLDENELIETKISKRTGGVLEDIVATIQQSQMEIIEEDPRGVCIVQGCVGSGKSTVAIHKLSHIFFNYPNLIKPQNSLLVAKNQILVGYLSTLFPKLGIFDINYGTIKDLIVRIFFKHDIKYTLDLNDETGMELIDLKLINLLKQKVTEIKEMVLEEMAKLQENPNYLSYLSFVYDDDLSLWENIQNTILDLEEEINFQKERLEGDVAEAVQIQAQAIIKNIKNLTKDIRKIFNNIRASFLPILLKDLGINLSSKLTYKQALIYCYIYSKFFGFLNFKKFEYCVVDEGQDFSLLEYLLLNELVIKGRFCILGDLNQSCLKTGLTNWDDISFVITEAKKCKKFELTTNYRSTKQIIDYACGIISPFTKDFLPHSINRNGPQVQVFRQSYQGEDTQIDMLMKMLDADLIDLNKSIGIICFDKDDFEKLSEILEKGYRNKLKDKLVVLNPKDRIFYTPKGVYLTMFENCKGLEFAKVYVVGMNEHPKDLHEAKMNYIAATRAMNELIIFLK